MLSSIYHTYIHFIEYYNRAFSSIDKKKLVLIFSNPRGGSTWLAEIMSNLPRSLVITEPLFKERLEDFKKLNFYWHQPIPTNAKWDEAEEAFQKLLNFEKIHRPLLTKHEILLQPFYCYYIFKFCYGNLLLPWLVDKFQINPILLIRHPCAVIASQLEHKAWNIAAQELDYFIPDFKYNEYYLQYEDILKKVKTPEEKFAATWALTMCNTVLHEYNDRRWITVSYENLYKNFEQEIERIFSRLNLVVPKNILNKKNTPSKTTLTKSYNFIQGGNQLESWRKKLSQVQIKNIFSILKDFNIDFYGESPEPDYSQIYKIK